MSYGNGLVSRPSLSPASAHALAQGLGWFSIALGLAEALAPRQLARALGMDEHEGLIRAYGVREIATGVAILTQSDPTPWIWGRVAGDALDFATLGVGASGPRARPDTIGLAAAAVAGVTVLDVICGQALTANKRQPPGPAPFVHDYRHRSGLRHSPEAMRGAARDVEVPRDMRVPEGLRPYPVA